MSSREVYDDAFSKSASIAFAQVFPAIMDAAVDMNLFEIVSKADKSSLGMSASEIASKLPKQHSEMSSRLERMLPSLVAHSLLTCSIRTINEDGDTERVYALSPVGQYFTSSDEQRASWTAMSTLCYQGFRHLWKDTKDAILDANNHSHFQKMYGGKSAFEYMETDRELGNLFERAMSQAGSLGMKSTFNAYKGFEGISTLADVGGGYGETLKQILFQYPSIKAINFDLPHVIKNAPPHPGIEHVGGDMFKSVPKADAILLKHVCHNWGDEECVKFLRNCYEALPPHGKVIVLDTLLPEIPKPTSYKDIHAVDVDFLMFLAHGGKERTEKQFQKLCKTSGFSRFQVACNDSSTIISVIEFYK